MRARRWPTSSWGVRAALGWTAPLALLMTGVVVAGRATGIPVAQFTLDVNSVYRVPFYVGLVSNVGILLWAATAGVCLFCAAATRTSSQNSPGERAFFLLGGLLTTLLLLDDLFMLHQDVFEGVFGIPEKLTYAGYGVAAAAYMVAFRRKIFSSPCLPLVAAMGLFAASIVIDLVAPHRELFEDGAKLLGIGCWAGYFASMAAARVRGLAIAAELAAIGQQLERQVAAQSDAVAALARLGRETGEFEEDERAATAATLWDAGDGRAAPTERPGEVGQVR